MTLLWAVTAVLTLAVALNLLLTFGLIRRLRLDGSDTASAARYAQVGARLPSFSVTTLGGSTLTDTDIEGDFALAFLSTGCAPCTDLVRRLRDKPYLLGTDHLIIVVADDHPLAAQQLASSLPDPGRIAVLEPGHPLLSIGDGVTAYPTLLQLHDRAVVRASHRPEDLHAAGTVSRA